MHKRDRLKAISQLVSTGSISRQEELSSLLAEKGFTVTQASVSRDLDELGITKVGGKYTLPRRAMNDNGHDVMTLLTAGNNLIVARCSAGLASAAAVRIDALGLNEIVGTVAGDDTIMIAVRDAADQKAVLKKIMEAYL